MPKIIKVKKKNSKAFFYKHSITQCNSVREGGRYNVMMISPLKIGIKVKNKFQKHSLNNIF